MGFCGRSLFYFLWVFVAEAFFIFYGFLWVFVLRLHLVTHCLSLLLCELLVCLANECGRTRNGRELCRVVLELHWHLMLHWLHVHLRQVAHLLHVSDLSLKLQNLLVLHVHPLCHVNLLSSERLVVLVANPEPLLVELKLCARTLCEDVVLESPGLVTVVPVVEVEEGDEVGVAVWGLLRDQINSVHLADALCLELLGDEGLYLVLILLLRLAALLAREATGIAARDVQRHLIIEGSGGRRHVCFRVDFSVARVLFVWEDVIYLYRKKHFNFLDFPGKSILYI